MRVGKRSGRKNRREQVLKPLSAVRRGKEGLHQVRRRVRTRIGSKKNLKESLNKNIMDEEEGKKREKEDPGRKINALKKRMKRRRGESLLARTRVSSKSFWEISSERARETGKGIFYKGCYKYPQGRPK